MLTLDLPTEASTLAFGTRLAQLCPAKFVIFLEGALGAGKTTLVRGFMRELGYQGAVKSPTYTLVEPYELNGRHIFHFDLYRVKDPAELEYIGLREYLSQPSILLIEWAERAKEVLPSPDLTCYIQPHENGRRLQISAATLEGKQLLKELS